MSARGALAWPALLNTRRFAWLALGLERLALAALLCTIVLLGWWYPITYSWFVTSWTTSSQYQLVTAFHVQFQTVVLYPSELAAAATIALWLLARIAASITRQERAPLRLGPLSITLPLIGLVMITALSATQAILPILSLETAAHLLLQAALVVVVFNMRPPRWAMVAPLALLLALEGALSLAQALTQSTLFTPFLLKWANDVTAADSGVSIVQLPDGERWLRAYGSFPHPNILGGFLCLALPLVTDAYLRLPRRRSLSGWLLLPALGLGLLALLLSFSRAAWLGLALSALWACLLLWQKRRAGQRDNAPHQRVTSTRPWLRPLLLSVLAVGLLAGLVATLGPEVQSRLLLSSSLLEQRSLDERTTLLEASAIFFFQHPWLGVGAGSMPLVELSYAPTRSIGEPVHNIPMLVAVETGIFGLLLWLIPPLVILWPAWQRRATLPTAGLAASAAVIALLTVAQLDHYLWSQPTGGLIWWLAIGLALLWGERGAAENRLAAQMCHWQQPPSGATMAASLAHH